MATNETPLMRQYEEMKAKHPDAVLLFRVGDFYESFREDAKTIADICGVTLTTRPGKSGERHYLAGFPHHALDTYLPKLMRAGKRVAICESREDSGKPEVVEKVSPAGKEERKPEPEKRPAPGIKEIGCEKDLFAKGEPIAYFHMRIPKEAKNLGKCINRKYLQDRYPKLLAVCVEPGNNRMIVSDTFVVQTINVECDGEWPQGEDVKAGGREYYQPFQCCIDPAAINHLAGKMVDVAVWQGENGKLDVTACEAEGVRTQYDETKTAFRFPDWNIISGFRHECAVKVEAGYLKGMRDWVKGNMGSATPARDGKWDLSNKVELHVSPDADTMMIHMYEVSEDGVNFRNTISAEFPLCEQPGMDLSVTFTAPLFLLCIDGDFNGEIRLGDATTPARFTGEYRESVLMPMLINKI